MNSFYKYFNAGTKTNALPTAASTSLNEGVLHIWYESKHIAAIDQLNFLKDEIGFNISEIAEILLATRPTVYKWLGGDSPTLRYQSRLDDIYYILSQWNTDLGAIAHWSRRKLFANTSLFSLLCSSSIDTSEILDYLTFIENHIAEAELRKNKRQNIQRNHNYQKIDEKEAQKALDRITKKIG